jgi:hypothetical protein
MLDLIKHTFAILMQNIDSEPWKILLLHNIIYIYIYILKGTCICFDLLWVNFHSTCSLTFYIAFQIS